MNIVANGGENTASSVFIFTPALILTAFFFSPCSLRGSETPTSAPVPFSDVNLGGPDVKKRCHVKNGLLHIQIPRGETPLTRITINKPLDVSGFRYLYSSVSNTGPETVVLRMWVRDARAKSFNQWGHHTLGVVVVRPGETKPLVACLSGKRENDTYLKEHLPNMNRFPGMFEFNFWRDLDASAVEGIELRPIGAHPDSDRSISLTPFRGALPISAPTEDELKSRRFFPFIDKYGQYNKLNWPDKIHQDEDLRAMFKKEGAWHATHEPRPKNWNQYGGWADGPRLKATGHFRTEKHQEKWWLVDPMGRLFWSKGSTGIGFHIGGKTPIEPEQRRLFFTEVGEDAIVKNRRGKKELIIGAQMEAAKYGNRAGDEWKDVLTIYRAWGFGLNTAGAWSAVSKTQKSKLPYTVMLHLWSPMFHDGLPDPFNPKFRESVEAAVGRTVGKEAEDPWCIGYFINNELKWESPLALGKRALAHAPDNAGKKALLDQLKSKYREVAKLNAAWKSSYPSWDALLAAREASGSGNAMDEDLTAFGNVFCETFFRTIGAVMGEKAPNKLYLGDRFNKNVKEAIMACSRHADVVSFNKYDLGIESLSLPEGSEDKPIIIGEFCFVRGGRRHVSAELGDIFDPDYRGRAYAQYIVGALQNPSIVGCHWFQWNTQPVSGRGDGENYEQGFLDVCDTPYWGLIHYSRSLAEHIYTIRLKGTSDFDYAPMKE